MHTNKEIASQNTSALKLNSFAQLVVLYHYVNIRFMEELIFLPTAILYRMLLPLPRGLIAKWQV